jgi:branched-chain amino acid transport system ATP-binding protein
VLVLDEPSQGLAPRLIAQVLGSVQEIQRARGIGVILVEQAVRAALPLADWVYVMNRGRVTRSMTPADLRALGEFDAVYLQDEVGERSGR